MKTLLTILAVILFYSTYAQTADAFTSIDEGEVPQAVLEKYMVMHPKNTADEWRVERSTYEAKFKSDDYLVYDRFNDEGLFLETRTLKNWESDASKNLKAGKNRSNYKYWNVIEFYEVTTAKKDRYYVVQLEDDNNKLQTIYFDESGTLDEKSKSGY